jgi:hypothetical protein
MALVKRKNSKFLYAQFQFNNKLYVKSTKTTNMTKAKRIERAMREQLVNEGYETKTRGTVYLG